MSTCTAAEIAEKRRIALEKLRAKKANAKSATSNNTHINIASTSNHTQNTTQTNSFKTALNALKQSSKLMPHLKDNARAATHPYQRPSIAQPPKTTSTNAAPKIAPVFRSSVSCKPYMISPSVFAVETSGYHAKLIEVFKTIPSKSYDNNTRIWSFSLKDYQLVQDRVGAMNPDVVIGSIPKKVLNLCYAPIKQLDRSCLASIETTLVEKLLPFQQEGVCFAIAQNGCVMICDEMGLGKTYQALAVVDFYREYWPLLICTTATNRESWSSHIRNLLPSLPVHYIQVLTTNDQYFGDAKVLIVSYSMLASNIEKLIQGNFGVLIFDESHQLKNAKAKCSQAADRLAQIAKHVILLSGTPALSRPLELFTQLQLVDRKFMKFMEFTARYCDGKQTHFGWDATGQSNLQELNVVLKLKFMIRRTKADVLPELAAKNRETIVLDPELLWVNDQTKETLNKFAKDFSSSKGKEKEEILLQFYSQTAAVKTRAVCNKSRKVWTHAETKALLDAYGRRKDEFFHSRKKILAWQNVAEDLGRGNMVSDSISAGMCHNKMKSLLRAYKEAVDNGAGSRFVPFAKELEELFGKSAIVANTHIFALSGSALAALPTSSQEYTLLASGSKRKRDTGKIANKWNQASERALITIWGDKMSQLRGCRKNSHILVEMVTELRNQGFSYTVVELKTKMHNLTARYRSYLKSVLKENVKFIVFAHHRIMLDAICDCLNKLHVNYIRIDGQTKNETRAEYINKFQTKSNCKVAVLSLRACNSGITLTAAEIIIFAELDWNPSTLAQAESRAHRIGQDKQVICRYLMATKTADDFIWNMLKNKQDVLNRAGLFCENLQDATHIAVQTISNKIERYFSPDKRRQTMEEDAKSPCEGKVKTEMFDKSLPIEEKSTKIIAELENVEEIFKDDDAFNDIIY